MQEDQPVVKRKRGRPPGHLPANQYTGVRAKNIDYVRQYLKTFLETEAKTMSLTTESKHKCQYCKQRQIVAYAAAYKMIVWACRLLLACENVYMMFPASYSKNSEAANRLQRMKEGLEAGTITMPKLLDELDHLEREQAADES